MAIKTANLALFDFRHNGFDRVGAADDVRDGVFLIPHMIEGQNYWVVLSTINTGFAL